MSKNLEIYYPYKIRYRLADELPQTYRSQLNDVLFSLHSEHENYLVNCSENEDRENDRLFCTQIAAQHSLLSVDIYRWNTKLWSLCERDNSITSTKFLASLIKIQESLNETSYCAGEMWFLQKYSKIGGIELTRERRAKVSSTRQLCFPEFSHKDYTTE